MTYYGAFPPTPSSRISPQEEAHGPTSIAQDSQALEVGSAPAVHADHVLMMDTSHSTKPVVPPNKTSSAPASSALERLMQKARAESEADLANRRAKRLKSSESSSSGASPGPEPKQNPTQGLNFFQSKNQETHGDGLPSDAAFATFKLLGGNKIKVLTIVDGEEEAQLRQAFDRARLRCKQRLDPESAEGRSRKDLVAAYELEVDNKMNLPETANIRRGKVVRAAPTGGDIFSNTTIVGVYPRTGHLDDIEKLNLERGCLQTPCTTKGFMEAALASMGLGSAKDVLCADKVPTCPEPNKLLDGVARTAFKGREHLFDLFSPGTHDFVAKTSSSLKVMFQPEIVAEHITRFSPYKDYFVVFDKSRPLTGAVHLGDATVLEVLRGTGAGANKFGTEPSLMLPFKEHPSSAGARNVPIEYRIQMLNRNDRVFTQIGDVLQTGTFRTVQPGSFFQLAFRTDGWENMAKIGELSAKTGGLERLMSLLDRTYLFPSKEQLPDMLVALQELGFEDSARIVEKSWDLHYVGKPTFQILAMLRVLQFNKETNQAGPSAGGKKSGPKLFAEKEGIYNPKFLGKKIEWVTAGAENQVFETTELMQNLLDYERLDEVTTWACGNCPEMGVVRSHAAPRSANDQKVGKLLHRCPSVCTRLEEIFEDKGEAFPAKPLIFCIPRKEISGKTGGKPPKPADVPIFKSADGGVEIFRLKMMVNNHKMLKKDGKEVKNKMFDPTVLTKAGDPVAWRELSCDCSSGCILFFTPTPTGRDQFLDLLDLTYKGGVAAIRRKVAASQQLKQKRPAEDEEEE